MQVVGVLLCLVSAMSGILRGYVVRGYLCNELT